MRLSPLYVSVHATDTAVRNRLLANPSAPSITAQLKALQRRGIGFHTQIVVCPGYNDGRVLERTLRDLLALRPATLSIGVVPVGLTRFRRLPLQAVDSSQARRICGIVEQVAGDERNAAGARVAFCADELFLKAGLPIPGSRYYAGYPQYENGIGMCRATLSEWTRIRRTLHGSPKQPRGRALVMTSVSGYPVVASVVAGMSLMGPGRCPATVAVANRFFGESVTVAGLLTARDVLRAADAYCPGRRDLIVLPAVMFNARGHTLDGYSGKRIARVAGTRVQVARGCRDLAAALGLPGRGGCR